MKFAARVFSFVFFLLFVSLLIIKPAFAQVQTGQNNPPAGGLHTYTQNVMIEVASSLTCLLTGIDPINPKEKCLGINNGKIGPVDARGGAIGAMGNLIALTFTPPLHTSDYVNYIAGNFGISKHAYAQNIDAGSAGDGGGSTTPSAGSPLNGGEGFAGLSPLLNIWTAFRNIAYLVFVLVFVVIGFAIMLRVHIDPRTVMTIENQIPRLIIGLILVTFSFAIAGLLVDLMWVLSYLVIGVFAGIPSTDPHYAETLRNASQHIQGENAIGVFNNIVEYRKIVGDSAGAVGGLVQNLLTQAFATPQNPSFWNFVTDIPKAFQNLVGILIAGIAGFVALIIIAVAVLFSLFRLWFALIQAYIFIIMDVALAPFWIIAGLMPGSGIGFSAWLKDLTANLLAFPATIVMFLLAKAFMTSAGQDGRIFVPPLVGNANVPGAIQALIALGIVLITPNIVTMIKKALKAPQMDMAAIGQAIGAGTALPMNTIKQTAGIIGTREEAYIKAGANNTAFYERKGIGRGLFGKFIGRG